MSMRMRVARWFTIPVLAAALCACALPAVPPLPSSPGLQCGPQQYPFNALQDFQRGQVVVRAQVGADGRLEPRSLEQAAASTHLNAASFDAVRQCRMPAAAPGTPVRLAVQYDFRGENEFLPIGTVSVLLAPAQSGP